MLYIVFLALAVVFLLLKTGLFRINLDLSFDLFDFKFHINNFLLAFRARISPITVFLAVAWFTGLNKVITIPAWVALLVIFIVLPSIFALFEKEK